MADSEDDTADSSPQAVDPKDPKSSKGWLAILKQAEKVFQVWQDKSDSIDRLYANLERLANDARDREYQLFWANIQVLGPSIYSRPPVPVIVPMFKDQRPLPRLASELLERSVVVSFKIQDIDGTMRLVRDDLNIVARGALWCRYEAKSDEPGNLGQQVCIEHKDRKDFLHDPQRKWADVDWVAGAAYMTRGEMRKRFFKTSGDAYKSAIYQIIKDDVTGEMDKALKAKVWEIWCESKNRCYWVTEGVDVNLDEGKPHLTLEGFFPAPRPAYGTAQRGSLVPVPDMLFYKDQLEEINEYTARIAALSEALRLKGFYPGGAGELSDAIEAAMKRQDDNAILVPISNWALVGGGAAKDMILWVPIDMVASTITELVELRKQVIEDVYQIMGLSDIMRGQTEASETLGAQQLKSQYGSVRIRDKQQELVRIALDVTQITAEIMAENFSAKSLLDMSQLEIPTDADVAKQLAPLRKELGALIVKIKQAASDPRIVAMAKANPQQAQQLAQQVQQQAQQLQQQIAKGEQTVTIEQVMKFLRDNRTRVFELDIETDSTITPDENAQKQRATEYVTAMSGLFGQLIPAIEQLPQAAPLAAEVIKWVNSQFRVGREFAASIDTFTDQMKQIAAQPKQQGPTPEQIKAQSDAQKQQVDAMRTQSEAQQAQAAAVLAGKQLELDTAIAQKDAALEDKRIELDRYKAQLTALTSINVAEIGAKSANDAQIIDASLDRDLGIADQQHDAAMQQADQAHEAGMAAMQQQHEAGLQQADQQHQQGMQADAQDAAMEQQESAQQAATEQEPAGA